MKILWFTNTPSLFDQGKHSYHGGGWIESLETLLKEREDVELAVAFFHKECFIKEHRNQTTYYPILKKSGKHTPVSTVLSGLQGRIEPDGEILPHLIKVIEDFKPDLIQVFGTEGVFASIQNYTTIPVVIHLQGLITPYLNAYFPQDHNNWSFIFSKFFTFKNLTGRGIFTSFKRFQKQAEREKRHFSQAKNIIGRTRWDRSISKIYAPNAQYFHINEVLRPVFYNAIEKEYKFSSNKITIVSTLSDTIYKGIDVMLKTVKLLKEQTNINFVWQVIGLDDKSDLLNHFSNTLKISPEQYNIEFVGKKTPEELVSILLEADLFIHPSYIDNSPNSVCEAQILGIPVIATNVGGVSSLIIQNKTGVLVPSNGVFEIVASILEYTTEPEKYFTIGKNARKNALLRHNTSKIIDDLMQSYLKIIYDKK